MPVNVNDIEKEILDYIRTNLITGNTPLDGDTLYDELGIDSYALIEMLLYLEAKYQCSLLDGQTQKKHLENTSALSEFIFSKQ